MDKAVHEKQDLLKNIELNEELKLHPLFQNKGAVAVFQDVSVSFGQRNVLKDFNLTVQPGEILALSGPNGCGKSTVIRLIHGEATANSGLLRLQSGCILSYVPQNVRLSGSMDAFIQEHRVDETLFKTILRKLDFSRDHFEHQLNELSIGQQKKIMLAMSLSQSAHLYLWDEPLNYVDVLSRIQLENLLCAFRPTMILVEHDAAFVKKVASRIIEM